MLTCTWFWQCWSRNNTFHHVPREILCIHAHGLGKSNGTSGHPYSTSLPPSSIMHSCTWLHMLMMNIVMIYSIWWNILWNWFYFCHKESKKEKLEKTTQFYFVCHSLSVQSSHILTRTWLLFCVSRAYHSSVCMYVWAGKAKKKHSWLTVGVLMELLEQPGAWWVHKITIIFTTRQACKTLDKPNQTKPNQTKPMATIPPCNWQSSID